MKTRKAFKQAVKYNQFSPQILCLQVSVHIIHWHCFQVSYARAHLAKRQNLHQKGPSVKSPEYANNRVKKLVIYYNITATLCKSFCDVINPSKIIKCCILQDEPLRSPSRLSLLSVTLANYQHIPDISSESNGELFFMQFFFFAKCARAYDS